MGKLQETTISLLSSTAITTFVTLNAETTIYTVPTARTCIPCFGFLRAAGDVGAAVITIGKDTAETDWIGATTVSNLDAAGDVVLIGAVPSATPAKMKEYAAAVVLKFKVTTAGNAVAGTFYLFGFLDDA
jgi:hypothetical protein